MRQPSRMESSSSTWSIRAPSSALRINALPWMRAHFHGTTGREVAYRPGRKEGHRCGHSPDASCVSEAAASPYRDDAHADRLSAPARTG